jgi:hypothetical protein
MRRRVTRQLCRPFRAKSSIRNQYRIVAGAFLISVRIFPRAQEVLTGPDLGEVERYDQNYLLTDRSGRRGAESNGRVLHP